MSESLQRFQFREFVRHWPFSSMPGADVERLVQDLQETYHPAGETVLQAGQPVPGRLGWLRRGRLHAGTAGDHAVPSQVWESGDCFQVGAFWAGQPLRQDHVAQSDCFVVWLAGDAFGVVLRQPPTRQADKVNILLHGIGLQDQQSG